MAAREEFWDSGLPFISDAEGKRIDWTDVGVTSLGVVLTSIYSNIAATIATLWQVVVIDRANDISAAYTGYIDDLFNSASAALSFDAGISFARDTGLIGAVVLVAAGGYLIAWVVGVIRDE
jgi:hypothetical protein